MKYPVIWYQTWLQWKPRRATLLCSSNYCGLLQARQPWSRAVSSC